MQTPAKTYSLEKQPLYLCSGFRIEASDRKTAQLLCGYLIGASADEWDLRTEREHHLIPNICWYLCIIWILL